MCKIEKYINQGNSIPKTKPSVGAGVHLFLLLCITLCSAFGVWAYYSELDIVSVADGRVAPSSKVKSVQHLEGGIVKEILVHEGDHVKVEQALVILEKTASGANVEELQIRINALQVDVARLLAEAAVKDKIQFPEALTKNHSRLVKQAREIFKVRRKRYLGELAGQKEKIRQRTQDISEIQARLKNTKKALRLLEKQIAISEDLLKSELTTQYKHLSLLREGSKLRSRSEEDAIALKRSRSALREAEGTLKNIKNMFREMATRELKATRQELNEVSQRVLKFSDSLSRTVIRSPVAGVVKALHIVTRGGVVQPGMTIMDIVPAADRLIVEAHLPTRDVGFVQTGQRAIVKLASQDARRFGKLEGKVVHVSPDAFATQQGSAFYTVRIETEKDYFEQDNLRYKLYPGVMVIASIHTGQRTVWKYLLDPFLNTLDTSFQER
ncbi:HlyD family type I secretion periplasmic adaptor subunit [Desulfococcaceae bacterium HSG9]|nr:HlyD family type I secretion periplasmic adaptor subunit [Desulfococcaceae bacterium HSG9]